MSIIDYRLLIVSDECLNADFQLSPTSDYRLPIVAINRSLPITVSSVASDRQIVRQTSSQAGRQSDRQAVRLSDRQAGMTGRQARHANRLADRQADR